MSEQNPITNTCSDCGKPCMMRLCSTCAFREHGDAQADRPKPFTGKRSLYRARKRREKTAREVLDSFKSQPANQSVSSTRVDNEKV